MAKILNKRKKRICTVFAFAVIIRKNSRGFNFANEPKSQMKMAIFYKQWRSLTDFSDENAISKISRGFNFAKPRNLI